MKYLFTLLGLLLISNNVLADGKARLEWLSGQTIGNLADAKVTCLSYLAISTTQDTYAEIHPGETKEVEVSLSGQCGGVYLNTDTSMSIGFELPYEFSRSVYYGDALAVLGLKAQILDLNSNTDLISLANNAGMKVCHFYRGVYINGMDKVPAVLRPIRVRLINTGKDTVRIGLRVDISNDSKFSYVNSPGC